MSLLPRYMFSKAACIVSSGKIFFPIKSYRVKKLSCICQKAFWQYLRSQNRFSKFIFQAFRAARVPTDDYLCEKAMRHILSYQDQKGSFGTILANTQIPPSLVGESLINLKKYACPVGKKQAFCAFKQRFVFTRRFVFTQRFVFA